MLCGLEIKRLSQLSKNKQKQDEIQTGDWLTSKKMNTCHATSVELCYFYKSRDELVSSDFHFQEQQICTIQLLFISELYIRFPGSDSLAVDIGRGWNLSPA